MIQIQKLSLPSLQIPISCCCPVSVGKQDHPEVNGRVVVKLSLRKTIVSHIKWQQEIWSAIMNKGTHSLGANQRRMSGTHEINIRPVKEVPKKGTGEGFRV